MGVFDCGGRFERGRMKVVDISVKRKGKRARRTEGGGIVVGGIGAGEGGGRENGARRAVGTSNVLLVVVNDCGCLVAAVCVGWLVSKSSQSSVGAESGCLDSGCPCARLLNSTLALGGRDEEASGTG